MITDREVEIRAYVEAYNDRVGDASLEYLRLALDLLDAARIPTEALDIARAIIEYGDQRAAEGRQQMLVDSTPLRDAIAREARAAALEEAAQIVEKLSQSPVGIITWDDVKAAIRALADTPPQSEGGEG